MVSRPPEGPASQGLSDASGDVKVLGTHFRASAWRTGPGIVVVLPADGGDRLENPYKIARPHYHPVREAG